MKIILPPVYKREVDSAVDGESDFFQRGKFSENLTELLRVSNESLVISIDSQWGDGKTSFLWEWIKELECGCDFIPIYYDAYRNDFTDDAFLSIATAIHKKLSSYKDLSSKAKAKVQFSALKRSMATVAGDMLKLASNIAVTNLTGGVLSGKCVAESVGAALGQVMTEALRERVEQKLEAHTEAQDHIEYYRDQLSEAIKTFGGKKLVFFVDELDRCRPNFSIQVIEKIKHLFDVDGVFFVLAINRRQLMSAIIHAYGVSSEDAEIYFQKFVHLETKLPSISRAISLDELSILRYVKSVFVLHGYGIDDLGEYVSDFIRLLGPDFLNLNPRAIERVATLISIVLTLSRDKSVPFYYVLVFISAAVRIGDSKYYFDLYSKCSFRLDYSGGGVGNKYYDFMFKVLGGIVGANNNQQSFQVPQLKKICDLIEIFDFPDPTLRELDS